MGVVRQACENAARRAVARCPDEPPPCSHATAARCPYTFHGLTDTETRYRRRYLDLLMNEDPRVRFRAPPVPRAVPPIRALPRR